MSAATTFRHKGLEMFQNQPIKRSFVCIPCNCSTFTSFDLGLRGQVTEYLMTWL